MPDTVDRTAKFRDAALVLAEDAAKGSAKLCKYIRSGHFSRAQELAAQIQELARDTKWLMKRLPGEENR